MSEVSIYFYLDFFLLFFIIRYNIALSTIISFDQYFLNTNFSCSPLKLFRLSSSGLVRNKSLGHRLMFFREEMKRNIIMKEILVNNHAWLFLSFEDIFSFWDEELYINLNCFPDFWFQSFSYPSVSKSCKLICP